MVYGPRDREVLKVFRLARLGLAPVFGDGTQELSAVHGADLADALIAAADQRGHGGAHLLRVPSRGLHRRRAGARGRAGRWAGPSRSSGSPRRSAAACSWSTEAAARLTGQTTILTADKANEFFQPAWTGDPAPLTRDTGWRATRDLRTGLAETYQWYRTAGWL